jgi:dihydrofolate reductase
MPAKRKIVVFDRVSADGYFSAPDGSLSWVVPDEEIDKEGASDTPGAGCLIFGRRTFDMFESFWPTQLGEAATAQDPHRPVRHSDSMKKMAVWLNEATKIVFSRTRRESSWKNTRFAGEFDASKVEALKSEPGKDILVFGSGEIVSLLAGHGLVDEYQLVVSPLVLGGGKSLLRGLPKSVPLRLVDAKSYSSGNVKLRYAAA